MPRDLEAFQAGLCHQDDRRQATFGTPLGDSMHQPIHTLPHLRERLARAAQDREALGEQYTESDIVFASLPGTPLLPDNVCRLIRSMCARAGVPYQGTQILRHSFILVQGRPCSAAWAIRAHVGHARASFTQGGYRSVFDEERKGMTLDFSDQAAAARPAGRSNS